MKIRFLGILLILFTFGCIGNEDPLVTLSRKLLSKEKIRIVFIGDIIISGYGLSPGQKNFFALLKKEVPELAPNHTIELINSSRSGLTSRTVFDFLDRDVLVNQPHVVVIMMGLSDYLDVRINPFEFYENIERLLARLPPKCGVILATSSSLEFKGYERNKRMRDYDIFMSALRSIADKRNLSLVDVLLKWEELRDNRRGKMDDLYLDSIHQNEK